MIKKLIELLPKKLAKHGLTRPVLAAQIVDAWDRVILEVFPRAQGKCQAIKLNAQNILTVRCSHAALAQELAMREDSLVAAYQDLFPQHQIKLRFQTGKLDPEEYKPSR